MRAALLLVTLLAIAAVSVSASSAPVETEPAIMTPPAAGLTKPRIFAPTPAADSADADAPLFGAPPASLKKAAVSDNIYGGAVEFEKSTSAGGCPCLRQMPEKFRYDAQFKRDPAAAPASCPCAAPKPAPKPEDSLPPVIAHIRKDPAPAPAAPACPKPVVPPVAKVTPRYYPKVAPAPPKPACPPPAPAPAKPDFIAPEFVRTPAERAARRLAKQLAKAN